MKNEESNLEDYKTNQKDRERAGEDTDQGRGIIGRGHTSGRKSNVRYHSTGPIFLINKNAINADKAAKPAQIRITFT